MAKAKLPKTKPPTEVKIQTDLIPIINAVVSNIKKINDYQVPEYETPQFDFKPGINNDLHRALRKYWSEKIQTFLSQF